MVKINKIYTRTGDDGTTGLVGGTRVNKDSLKVEAYGDIDELNSFLGQARTRTEHEKSQNISEKLSFIQQWLFDIGAHLASPSNGEKLHPFQIGENHISCLEDWIDEFTEGVPELRSFVLPGGSELNAELHIARAVCRRAERKVVALSRIESVAKTILVFLNRLSDLLFAMARFVALKAGKKEYLWVSGLEIP